MRFFTFIDPVRDTIEQFVFLSVASNCMEVPSDFVQPVNVVILYKSLWQNKTLVG